MTTLSVVPDPGLPSYSEDAGFEAVNDAAIALDAVHKSLAQAVGHLTAADHAERDAVLSELRVVDALSDRLTDLIG